MARQTGIGIQDFSKIIENNCFYVDKAAFIKEWWENRDDVTLITRPRRFGKTLTMSMVEQFFSVQYADRGDLFHGLSIWKEESYRRLQGAYPVISLSFADVKETNFAAAREKICRILVELYDKFSFFISKSNLTGEDKEFFRSASPEMSDSAAAYSLKALSQYLSRRYGKKAIILLDEYDTPMQEAFVHGYWEEMAAFMRGLFNSTFKTNAYLDRAIMTGITRISRESIFSDLNHLEIVTVTSDKYMDSFGFTQEEVFAAMDEFGLTQRDRVKEWYDGFTFGTRRDIHNPWSILNYLDKRQFSAYWANTSSNSLIGRLVRQGSPDIKMTMESLLKGGVLCTQIDEQIVFDRLGQSEISVWSLLLASGYLKVESRTAEDGLEAGEYTLSLTNMEVRLAFERLVRGWFEPCAGCYNRFIRALLSGDLEDMNGYMNDLALELFSSFDGGRKPPGKARPERFYHGFVLGLLVELKDRYSISSNGESGYGRYDIMLEPKKDDLDAFLIEFKVVDAKHGETMETCVESALRQITEMQYDAVLKKKGIPAERIHKYGFAFEGKTVLIG